MMKPDWTSRDCDRLKEAMTPRTGLSWLADRLLTERDMRSRTAMVGAETKQSIANVQTWDGKVHVRNLQLQTCAVADTSFSPCRLARHAM